jgi:surfeit locus 1 family protein
MQFKFLNLEFKPTLFGTLITLIIIPIFINLGLWQYHKAMFKQSIQNEFAKNESRGEINLARHLEVSESLQYQKIKVFGEYDSRYQLLIDNKVENDKAGFHVVTPLRIENSDTYVLVNRGWIMGKDKHADIPNFDTPRGMQEIDGVVWLPSKKFFSLEDKNLTHPEGDNWQLVWQNLDMEKYKRMAPISVLPVIIKLDPKSNAGGFLRNWQIDQSRVMTNLGYAYQWFGFAFAAFVIYLYMSFKRTN